jgi:MHS family proline/betaine transporter-like MFS transporter
MISRISNLSKWGMLLGNLFEHYDAALFSLLSPFLAPLFFPEQDPLTALILTYCIIPLGMVARPIGSLVFGYIGDTRGRKEALVLSLSGMAIVTGSMGFLPTYHQAGMLAPILLSISRIFQNFFAAGETMGGAIYLIENSPESYKDIISSLYNSSTVAGILLASAGVSALCALNLVQDYWRYLYFSGCLTAVFTAFLRIKAPLKSLLINLSPEMSFTFKSILQVCWNRWQALVAIAIASGFSYASYTLSLVVMNGFAPLVSSVSKTEMMHLNTFLLGLDFLLLPPFGMLAKRFSRENMMIISSALAMLSGFPLFWFLEGASLFTVIFIRLLVVIIGVWFSAPLHAWSQTLVPSSHRYTVISFGYAIGAQVLGGPMAAISLWLFQQTNWIISVGWYWMILGLLASYFVAKQEAQADDLNKFHLLEKSI